MKIHRFIFQYIGFNSFEVLNKNGELLNAVKTIQVIYYIDNPEYEIEQPYAGLPEEFVEKFEEYDGYDMLDECLLKLTKL